MNAALLLQGHPNMTGASPSAQHHFIAQKMPHFSAVDIKNAWGMAASLPPKLGHFPASHLVLD